MKYKLLIASLLLLYGSVMVSAQTEAPPPDTTVVDSTLLPGPVSLLEVYDTDNDHGHAITVEWEPSADDGGGMNSVVSYEVYRWVPYLLDSLPVVSSQVNVIRIKLMGDEGTEEDKVRLETLVVQLDEIAERLPVAHAAYPENGEWRMVGASPSGERIYSNTGGKEAGSDGFIPDFCDFYYRVDAVTANSKIRTASEIIGPVQSYGQWFNNGRVPVLVAVLLFGFLTLFFVRRARKGADLYVRPLSGIEAVDDAIGRATEMGRPILYVMGLGTAADIATIASFTILGRVAKRVAEYQTELLVPTYDPIVMSVAQEVVKSAYLDAGRADAYQDDIVHFVTQSQFAYVAAVNGIMLRELPATNVYMGKFFAESLLLAETGALAGSIQISGTDEIAQIPFFIVACDYTLIGEELYAASAYLGREPVLLGSLKAQDYAKATLIILAIIGIIAANTDWTAFTSLFRVAN